MFDNSEIMMCKCDSCEHQVIFRWDNDEKEVRMEVHLTKLFFWERVVAAIKYIFGYQCKYGAFDPVILEPKDCDKLQRIVDHLREGK